MHCQWCVAKKRKHLHTAPTTEATRLCGSACGKSRDTVVSCALLMAARARRKRVMDIMVAFALVWQKG